MTQTRRTFTAQQKVAILREHLLEHIPVSDICDTHKLNPNIFYRWQKQFFEKGVLAFENKYAGTQKKQSENIEKLKREIAKKDSIIASVAEDYTRLKKELGEL